MNEESSKGASPHKKARLSNLNKRWDRIRAIIQSRERKLKALGVIVPQHQTPSKDPIVESVVPEREQPVLASSPDDKKPELNRSTPKSKPSTPVRGSPLRELKTPPSGDKKSPKTKKNQYEEELREFSEWLTTQEKAFHELVGDENLPPTMEALKDRLKQFQVLLGVLGEDSSCRRKCEKYVTVLSDFTQAMAKVYKVSPQLSFKRT